METIYYFKEEKQYLLAKEYLIQRQTLLHALQPYILVCKENGGLEDLTGATVLTHPVPEETFMSIPEPARMFAKALLIPKEEQVVESRPWDSPGYEPPGKK